MPCQCAKLESRCECISKYIYYYKSNNHFGSRRRKYELTIRRKHNLPFFLFVVFIFCVITSGSLAAIFKIHITNFTNISRKGGDNNLRKVALISSMFRYNRNNMYHFNTNNFKSRRKENRIGLFFRPNRLCFATFSKQNIVEGSSFPFPLYNLNRKENATARLFQILTHSNRKRCVSFAAAKMMAANYRNNGELREKFYQKEEKEKDTKYGKIGENSNHSNELQSGDTKLWFEHQPSRSPCFQTLFQGSITHGFVLAVHLPNLEDGKCISNMLKNLISNEGKDTSSGSFVIAETPHRNEEDKDWLVSVANQLKEELHPLEIDYGLTNLPNDKTRICFWGGRLALRRILQLQKIQHHEPILKAESGIAMLPPDIKASISHKDDIALCLLNTADEEIRKEENNDTEETKHQRLRSAIEKNFIRNHMEENVMIPETYIGVDVEVASGHLSIGKRVLTLNEQEELGIIEHIEKNISDHNSLSVEENIMIRFSYKEAIYKAIYPIVQRFVSFQEAEAKPQPDGYIITKMLLRKKIDKKDNSNLDKEKSTEKQAPHKVAKADLRQKDFPINEEIKGYDIEGRWYRIFGGRYILTSAIARKKEIT